MKNELDNSFFKDYTNVDSQHKFINCPYSKPSTHVCSNKNCLNSAFICADKSCDCFKNHRNCPHISIESIKNNINAKIIPSEKIHESIIEKIDKTIDELSDFRQKLSDLIKLNLQFYGLTQNDSKFLNALNASNGDHLTGKTVLQMFTLSLNQQNKLNEKNSIDKIFTELWQSFEKQLNSKTTEIFKLFDFVKDNKLSTQFHLFRDSKVILNNQYKLNLTEMFSEKTLLETKLLYRASQQNFSANVFHDKCDNIPHTVTVCKTQHGKVIGGYTPLVWNKSGLLLQDLSGNSFIFSLTNNHKFTLDRNKLAIYQYKDSGPLFGFSQPDFHIADSANLGKSSWTKINQSYHNENYIADNPASFNKFNGDPQNSFYYKVEEWEVWQIKFTQ